MELSPVAFDIAGLADWAGDVNSGCLFHAARVRGIAADRVAFAPRSSSRVEPWLKLRIGRRTYMYRKAIMYFRQNALQQWQHVNGRAPYFTASKHRANGLLRAARCSVPEGRLFSRTEFPAARDFFLSLRREVCVKPDKGQRGVEIVPKIGDLLLFEQAFSSAAKKHDNILVEENVSGEVIRFMIVGRKVVATRLDRPASVLGDGIHTVAELAAAKNAEILAVNLATWSPIALDVEAERMLALQRSSMDSTPGAGQRVYLRATSNIPTGADGIGNPEGLHPSYADMMIRAVDAVPGLVLTALDVMMADYRAPATDSNHWILDINSAPGIVNFHFTREGQPTDVAGYIMDWLIAGGPR